MKLPDAHNHPNHQTKLKVDSVLKSIKKRRCREETTPIPTIYDQEVSKLRNPEWNEDALKVVEQLPTFESSRGSFYNERAKIIPILPATRSDIILEGQWTLTTANQRFLIADDGNDERILIFSTQQNLTHFTAADIIYGDGTFYTCPDVFTQLYTFHTYVDGTMYPLVYALLPGKSETVYTKFLTLLKQACDQHQLQLQPSTIFLDYEIAIRNAAYRIFPGITAKGCFFHYTQCIWRKTQDTGLQIHYKNNNHIKTLVRRAAVLPLVPIEHVQDIWFNALVGINLADTNINTESFTDCHRVLGRKSSTYLESLRHRWTQNNKSSGRFASQIEEPRCAPTSKHILPHQST